MAGPSAVVAVGGAKAGDRSLEDVLDELLRMADLENGLLPVDALAQRLVIEKERVRVRVRHYVEETAIRRFAKQIVIRTCQSRILFQWLGHNAEGGRHPQTPVYINYRGGRRQTGVQLTVIVD